MLHLVWTLTDGTSPCVSGKVCSTIPNNQDPRGAVESATMTISPVTKLLLSFAHRCRSCSSGKYSRIHLCRKRFERNWICLHRRLVYKSLFSKSPGGRAGLPFNKRMWFGVRGSRSLGSSEIFVMGRSFNMASTSHRRVCNPSSSTFCVQHLSDHTNDSLPCSAMMWCSRSIEAPFHSRVK